MSESQDVKPVVRFLSTIQVDFASYGPLRFRNWTLKAGTAINRLCGDDLTARRFAQRLFVELAIDPVLTETDVEQWSDAGLLEVATKWWQGAEQHRRSSTTVDSLQGFQDAVRNRNEEHKKSARTSIERIAGLQPRFFEHHGVKGLAEQLARSRHLLDLAGQSSIQRAIAEMHFAKPLSAFAALQELRFQKANWMGIASLQERLREAQLFSATKAIDFSKFTTAASFLAAYAAEAERSHRQIIERLRVYETAFDTSRLKDVLRDLDMTGYKRFAPDFAKLESIADSFKVPWIDRITPEVSVTGLARIAALSAAAQSHNPFDNASVAAMRAALGDWREIKMPWRLLPDTSLREQFYIERGFDTTLIRLPEPAFSETLERVGLARPQQTPIDADVEIDEEEILRQRMSQVYELLFRLERKLRAYIDRVMMDKYGPDWERHRCHGNGQIYKKWVQKRDYAVQSGSPPERLIQYADFTEYADLITKADNWKEVFQEAFDRPESVRESFHRLGPVRLCTMHARPITKTELILASAEITRLLIAIGEVASDDQD